MTLLEGIGYIGSILLVNRVNLRKSNLPDDPSCIEVFYFNFKSLAELIILGDMKLINHATSHDLTSLISFSYFEGTKLRDEDVFSFCNFLNAVKVFENYKSKNLSGIQTLISTG